MQTLGSNNRTKNLLKLSSQSPEKANFDQNLNFLNKVSTLKAWRHPLSENFGFKPPKGTSTLKLLPNQKKSFEIPSSRTIVMRVTKHLFTADGGRRTAHSI
jgi:hypothetical protein